MSIAVITRDGQPPVPAEDIAAQALAEVLARDSFEDTAVAQDSDGNYLVMAYGSWRAQSHTGGPLAKWTLRGVVWKASV